MILRRSSFVASLFQQSLGAILASQIPQCGRRTWVFFGNQGTFEPEQQRILAFLVFGLTILQKVSKPMHYLVLCIRYNTMLPSEPHFY